MIMRANLSTHRADSSRRNHSTESRHGGNAHGKYNTNARGAVPRPRFTADQNGALTYPMRTVKGVTK